MSEQLGKDFTEAVLKVFREVVAESKSVHPHDIMGQILSSAESIYKLAEYLPYSFYNKE